MQYLDRKIQKIMNFKKCVKFCTGRKRRKLEICKLFGGWGWDLYD